MFRKENDYWYIFLFSVLSKDQVRTRMLAAKQITHKGLHQWFSSQFWEFSGTCVYAYFVPHAP